VITTPGITSGEGQSDSTMRLRADLRGAGGPLAAPLGVMQQAASGILIDHMICNPTQIEVHVVDPADDVAVLRNHNTVHRLGKRMVFTEGRIVDDANPDRLIAYGNISWAVLGDNPAFVYTYPGEGPAEDPEPDSLRATFNVRPRDDGEYEIAEATPPIGTRGGLHGGTIQILTEAGTTGAAEGATAPGAVAIVDHSTMLIGPSRVGPYMTRSEVTSITNDMVVARTLIIDTGDRDRLVALGQSSFRRL
jgi:acyl-coenzyme A thioesterase PaaI-like protein